VLGKEEERRIIEPEPVAGSSIMRFKFTGKGAEYFKIWIVNVFLTMLTLGIYSAWAKVRKKQYFYGNTFLHETSFDYLADPIKILKGRLIAFAILIISLVTIYFLTYLALLLLIPVIALFPWLVVRALSFRARNSCYRNIRFDFSGTYGAAMRIFIGRTIITLLTFGLLYPSQVYRRTKFLIDYSSYGTTSFRFSGDLGSFYRIYFWQVLGLSLLLGILLTVAKMLGQFVLPVSSHEVFEQLISLPAGLTVIAFVRAAVANLVWSNVRLGDDRFDSRLSCARMIWIYLSNATAILFSLGLLIPWASIRVARYRFDHLYAYSAAGLNNFVAREQENVGALGEEVSGLLDFDVGL
jgi:uncharacterized membrane protein YjgN (DUF898 family)